MAKDNNSKGIFLIIIAMTLFAMQDSLIKYIFEKSSLYEIFFGRYFVAAVLLFSYIKFKKQKVSLKTNHVNQQIFKGDDSQSSLNQFQTSATDETKLMNGEQSLDMIDSKNKVDN